MLLHPQGVTTDNHDNVYIVGCLSNNIHRLRPDGTFIDIILTEEDNVNPSRLWSSNLYFFTYLLSNYIYQFYIVIVIKRHHNHISTRYCSYIVWFIPGSDMVLGLVVIAINQFPVKERQSQMLVVGRNQMSSFIHDGDIKTNSRHGGAICISAITVIDNDMIVLCDSFYKM
jgi:hypothetical protein